MSESVYLFIVLSFSTFRGMEGSEDFNVLINNKNLIKCAGDLDVKCLDSHLNEIIRELSGRRVIAINDHLSVERFDDDEDDTRKLEDGGGGVLDGFWNSEFLRNFLKTHALKIEVNGLAWRIFESRTSPKALELVFEPSKHVRALDSDLVTGSQSYVLMKFQIPVDSNWKIFFVCFFFVFSTLPFVKMYVTYGKLFAGEQGKSHRIYRVVIPLILGFKITGMLVFALVFIKFFLVKAVLLSNLALLVSGLVLFKKLYYYGMSMLAKHHFNHLMSHETGVNHYGEHEPDLSGYGYNNHDSYEPEHRVPEYKELPYSAEPSLHDYTLSYHQNPYYSYNSAMEASNNTPMHHTKKSLR